MAIPNEPEPADREGYDELMTRILQAQTEVGLKALVTRVVAFEDDFWRRDFAEAWWRQWRAYVGKPVPDGLWPAPKHLTRA